MADTSINPVDGDVTTAADPPGGGPPSPPSGGPPIKPPGGGGPPGGGDGNGGVIDPGGGNGNGGSDPGGGPGNGNGEEPTDVFSTKDDEDMILPEETDFDEWFVKQDDFTQAMIEIHTAGLRSALKSERRQNTILTQRLKKNMVDLEEASQSLEKLDEVNQALVSANQRADFFEKASGIKDGVIDIGLAWLAIEKDNLMETYTIDGTIDYAGLFAELRNRHPKLFGRLSSPTIGNAGDGIGQRMGIPVTMNDLIRQQAGYG